MAVNKSKSLRRFVFQDPGYTPVRRGGFGGVSGRPLSWCRASAGVKPVRSSAMPGHFFTAFSAASPSVWASPSGLPFQGGRAQQRLGRRGERRLPPFAVDEEDRIDDDPRGIVPASEPASVRVGVVRWPDRRDRAAVAEATLRSAACTCARLCGSVGDEIHSAFSRDRSETASGKKRRLTTVSQRIGIGPTSIGSKPSVCRQASRVARS